MRSSLSSDRDISPSKDSSIPSPSSQRAIITSILLYNIVIVTIIYLELSRINQPLSYILIFTGLLVIAIGIIPSTLLFRLFSLRQLQSEQLQANNLRLREEIVSHQQVETALLENQKQFQAIFDNAQDAIVLMNQETRYIGANPAACALLGYTHDEFLQLYAGDVIPAYANESVRQAAMQEFLTRTKPSKPVSIEMRHKDGHFIPVEVQAVPNILPGVHLGIVRDINYRIEVEQALHASEERHRKVSELISDYAFMIIRDDEGNMRREWLTDSFYKMSGYSKEESSEFVNRLELTHPDDREQARLDQARTLAGEQTITESRFRIKSGEYIWLRIKREPIWDESHQDVIGYYAAAHNITAEKEALASLRLSEARYRKATELMSDYSFAVKVNPDKSLELEWVTPSYQRIMGYSEADIVQDLTVKARTHSDHVEQATIELQQVLEGKTISGEYRARKKSGDYLWLHTIRQPEIDENGQVIRYYGASRNITTQKEVELALRESELRYRKVAEIISDYAFSIRVNEDKSLELIWITPSFYRIMGYKNETDLGEMKLQTHVHPDDLEQAQVDLDRVLNGESVTSIYRQQTFQGNYLWVQISRNPVIDEQSGRVIAFYAAASDITAQKEAEIALRESEIRYRKTTEIISDYAFSIRVNEDKSLELEWITPSYYRVMGYDSGDEVILLSLESEAHPDDYQEAQNDLDRVLNGEFVTSTFRQRTKSGKFIWLQVSRDPVWDEEKGRVISYYGAARDISAQKAAEIALRESEDRYRKISQIVSDFAYEVEVRADNSIKLLWVLGPFEDVVGFEPGRVSHIQEIGFTAHPDDKFMLQADIERTLQNQLTISTYRILKDEVYRWIRVTRTPTWNAAEGRVDKILAAVSDVTIEKSAELMIQESERRYALVSRIMSDFAYSLRVLPDGSLEDEWLLGSFEEVIGLSQAEFSMARNWDDVTYPEDVARVNADINKTAEGIPTVTEYRVINQKTQAIHWIRVTREPVQDENGQVLRILGATKDITQEKEAQAAFIQSEERYRLLTEVISDYVFSLKVKDDGSLENEWLVGSFEQITGVPIGVSGFGVNRVRTTHPEDIERVKMDVERSISGTKTVSEYRIINAVNQQIRWIQVTRFPIWDETHQRVIRILGAAKDISPQKEADAALRYSEERYRMLTTLMTDYAFSMRLDDEGNLHREWVVGSFEEITGVPIHMLPPVNRSGQTTFKEDEAKLIEDIERTKKGETTVTEYRIVNAVTKEVRWLRVTRHPIWNSEHTQVVQFIGAAKDITAEKEAQQAAHEADLLRQDLLREKDLHELRSRFVSMVTHEFRNPLAAIQSSASILEQYQERLSAEKRQEKYVNIYRQIDRLTNLLEDLLGVGELENKTYQFNPQRIDILDVVRDLLDEYRESIGKTHQLVLDSPHEKVTSAADYQLLHRAFGNIISNAIKYSPTDTTVTCRVNIVDEEVILTISDEGMGIPETDFNKLFEAFFRASNVGSKPGTGLGLVIAQQAIEIHKGQISFDSKLGHGTTFTIRFPRVIGTDSD